jgi:methylmalonyl-CoA/ethylmalonyl-CoA epimerase
MLENLTFHHIGYATNKISNEIEYFFKLGYELESDFFEDELQGIRGCFLVGNGPRLELLENLTNSRTLDPWLESKIKMYHMAYTTKNLDSSIDSAQKGKGKLIVPPTTSIAFNGNRIAFISFRNVPLLELIELPD